MACAMVPQRRQRTPRPTNVASGKRYRGINTLALWAAGLAAEYGDGLWGASPNKWRDSGAQVREGGTLHHCRVVEGDSYLPAAQ